MSRSIRAITEQSRADRGSEPFAALLMVLCALGPANLLQGTLAAVALAGEQLATSWAGQASDNMQPPSGNHLASFPLSALRFADGLHVSSESDHSKLQTCRVRVWGCQTHRSQTQDS